MAIEDSNSNDTSNWNNLPSLILNEIFSYLEYKEKLQASSSCKQWRIAFHHTNQLPDVHFHIRKHDEDKVVKSNYIAQCIAPKVKHLTVSFDSISALCLQLLANILEEVSFNAKVKRVVLNPSHCSFQKDGAFIQRLVFMTCRFVVLSLPQRFLPFSLVCQVTEKTLVIYTWVIPALGRI